MEGEKRTASSSERSSTFASDLFGTKDSSSSSASSPFSSASSGIFGSVFSSNPPNLVLYITQHLLCVIALYNHLLFFCLCIFLLCFGSEPGFRNSLSEEAPPHRLHNWNLFWIMYLSVISLEIKMVYLPSWCWRASADLFSESDLHVTCWTEAVQRDIGVPETFFN